MAKGYHWYKWLPIGNVVDFIQNASGNGDGSFMSQLNGGFLHSEMNTEAAANAGYNGQDFSNYYQSQYGENPGSVMNRIENFFTGNIDAEKSAWETSYNTGAMDRSNAYNIEATRALRSTEYSDIVKSIEDAGLNPYVILGSGAGVGSSPIVSSSPLKVGGSSKSSKSGAAALLYLIGRIVAAIITKGVSAKYDQMGHLLNQSIYS